MQKEACSYEKACRLAWMDSELFFSGVKSDLLYGIQRTSQSERESANKGAFMQAKAWTQKQAFNVSAAYQDIALS